MVDVSFTPGNRTSNAFQVRLIADTYPEEDEVFRLRLEKSSGQEVSGALNDRINFPSRLPKTATILNGEARLGYQMQCVQAALIYMQPVQ